MFGHVTRYHGVFAPHSRWRAQITPAGRGSGSTAADTRTPAERHRAMRWAQRLKRVFKRDLSSCEHCGGQVRVIVWRDDLDETLATIRMEIGECSAMIMPVLIVAGKPYVSV